MSGKPCISSGCKNEVEGIGNYCVMCLLLMNKDREYPHMEIRDTDLADLRKLSLDDPNTDKKGVTRESRR